jgi:ribonuclease HII
LRSTGGDKGSLSLFGDLAAPEGPWEIERELKSLGFRSVAGVDEVGRGPLAGPVLAAAVILDDNLDYPGVGDSKKMTPEGREQAFWLIIKRARAIGLGLASQADIDRMNILQASLEAMGQAIRGLGTEPDFIVVDGNCPVPVNLPQRALPRGDARSLSIGAASIVAKVIRDRMMMVYDRLYPGYGFASHKGYGTKSHLEALALHGPCGLHRLSFRRVKRGVESEPAS